ncbi:MAG: hypothetical protein HY695_30955 [Deltaproteobacteria bacterium]|nr:hypothetical protein [Deltaproteobacteria bacterium]
MAGIAEAAEEGRIGCPRCKNDGSQMSIRLQKADDLYAAFKTKEALGELQKVLEVDPQNHEALSKIARVYVDFGDMVPEGAPDSKEKKLSHYQKAEEYARKAVKSDPHSTWGHFYVAVSLGKIAALSSISRQVELAGEVREAVEKAIAQDPKNGYAYHVYGIWHRRMAEIGQMSRMLASMVLWRTIPQGSLEKSAEYLKKAISLNPSVIASHLELGKSYVAMGKMQLALSSLTTALELPIHFSDDPEHKKAARQLLQEIKDR